MTAFATRLQQGLRALFASMQALDYQLAERYLSPTEMALFKQLAPSEQLHSLNVLRDVLAHAQQTPPDLAVAALLHDIGKIHKHLSVFQKTVAVLIRAISPALDDHLSRPGALSTWRAPFIVRRHHPQWSGELLTQAGSSEGTIWLATHHADDATRWTHHPYHGLLLRLQSADDAN